MICLRIVVVAALMPAMGSAFAQPAGEDRLIAGGPGTQSLVQADVHKNALYALTLDVPVTGTRSLWLRRLPVASYAGWSAPVKLADGPTGSMFVTAGSTGAFVSYAVNNTISLRRFAANGSPQGTPLTLNGYGVNRMVSDMADGVWVITNEPGAYRARRIGPDREIKVNVAIPLADHAYAVADGAGGVVIVASVRRNTSTQYRDIVLHRFAPNGAALWGATGKLVTVANDVGAKQLHSITANGGRFLVRYSSMNLNVVLAQVFGLDGRPQWPANFELNSGDVLQAGPLSAMGSGWLLRVSSGGDGMRSFDAAGQRGWLATFPPHTQPHSTLVSGDKVWLLGSRAPSVCYQVRVVDAATGTGTAAATTIGTQCGYHIVAMLRVEPPLLKPRTVILWTDGSEQGDLRMWTEKVGDPTPITAPTITATKTTASFFCGIEPPIRSDGSSIFRLGRTIPVKFKLTCGGNLANVQARLFTTKLDNGVLGTQVEATMDVSPDTGNLFRYDAAASQYIFNLSTQNLSVGTWQLKIEFPDGSSRTSRISLRDR